MIYFNGTHVCTPSIREGIGTLMCYRLNSSVTWELMWKSNLWKTLFSSCPTCAEVEGDDVLFLITIMEAVVLAAFLLKFVSM